MSRSKKDQAGGHPWPGYNKENWVVKALDRRKHRRAGKKQARDFEDEKKIPNPERSSQGWKTW